MGRRAALLCAFLWGCAESPTTLLCHIDVASGVTLAELNIRVRLGTGAEVSRPLATAAPKLPGSVLVVLPDVVTSVDVALTAKDDQGAPFSAEKVAQSEPHRQVEMSLTLGSGELPDGGIPDGTVLPDLAGDLAHNPINPTTLSVLAGNPGGQGHADGVGSDARLNNPQGVALSGSTLYIVDGSGYLRALDTTTNTLTTVPMVDNVLNPYTFNYPQGVVFDGTDTFYVASSNEALIVKVVLMSGTGRVSFLAGTRYTEGSSDGVGLAASFDYPTGLALDGSGQLWVADTGNSTIRVIDLASQNVTTVAGTPGMTGWVDMPGSAARFDKPNGLVLFGGELYVGDGQPGASGNTAVRKVAIASPSPMPVSTVVGTAGVTSFADGPVAGAGFGNALGLASNGSLFVVDANRNNMRSVVPGGSVTTLVGDPGSAGGTADGNGTAARFLDPRWLAVDATTGWMSDDDGQVVRRIGLGSPYPVTTPVGLGRKAGSSDGTGMGARFNQPAALVAVGDTVYVTEWSNSTVRKVTLDGVVTTLAGGGSLPESTDGQGTNSTFAVPSGIAADNQGNLWVTDADTSLLREITFPGGVATVTTVAGKRYDSANVDGVGAAAQFGSPAGIAFDGDHTMFIADRDWQTIRSVDINSLQVTTIAGEAGMYGSRNGAGLQAHFSSPAALAYDQFGQKLYVSEGACDIRLITFNPVTVSKLSGSNGNFGHDDGAFADATFSRPEGLALDGNILWVADTYNGTIRRMDLVTQMVSTPVGTVLQLATRPGPLPAALNQPWGIAVTSAGLVVSSLIENTILLVH